MGRKYVKEMVPAENVYELTRYYRYSKANPGFVHIITTAKRYNFFKNLRYYISMYKYDQDPENFVMRRHGNAKKPTAAIYHRTDVSVFN